MGNGYGKYFYTNGDIYEGDFVDNKFSGFGAYQFGDGSVHKGFWSKSKRHGKGFYLGKDFIVDGEWNNDKRHGKFVSYIQIGQNFEELYEDDTLKLSK